MFFIRLGSSLLQVDRIGGLDGRPDHPACLRGVESAFDGDAARLFFFVLRYLDCQDTVLYPGGYFRGICCVRKRKASQERAADTFGSLVAFPFLFRFAGPLALYGQYTVIHGDIHITGIDTRNVGMNQIPVFLFLDIHRRYPVRCADAAVLQEPRAG